MHHTTPAIALLLVCILGSLVWAADDPGPPSTPLKIFITLGKGVVPYDGISSTGDSVTDIRTWIEKDNRQWLQVIESKSKADMIAEIMGRRYIPLGLPMPGIRSDLPGLNQDGQTDLLMQLIVGNQHFSFVGALPLDPRYDSAPDWVGAAQKVEIGIRTWVRRNHSLIRQKLFIPGSSTEMEFTASGDPILPIVSATPPGPRIKVFCGSIPTPPEYAENWSKGKEDSVKDLSEDIRNNSTWLELVGNEQSADLAIHVLGRGVGLGQEIVWVQLVYRGEPINVSGVSQTWRTAAHDAVRQAELWAQKNYK